MKETKADFTNTFRDLTDQSKTTPIFEHPDFISWEKEWSTRSPSQTKMKSKNPIHIPRNHAIEFLIQNPTQKSLSNAEKVLTSPFTLQKNTTLFSTPPKTEEKIQFTYCGT